MRIRFWGTRGSLAAPLSARDVRAKLHQALARAAGQDLGSDAKIEAFIDSELDFPVAGTYGGNTSCVEIDAGDEYVVCDMGTGVRELGNRFLSGPDPHKKKVFNFFLSHVHWDHIMGFPFFVPAYIPGHTIRIHGCHAEMEAVIRAQHDGPSFPVSFDMLGADIEFVTLAPGESYEVAGLTVRVTKQHHGGDSYGYRFEGGGRCAVYSTDSEPKMDSDADVAAITSFFKDADLVVFDAMYSLAESVSIKEDWGHSSNIVGVELCQLAGVKHYCMFHHEPIYDDATLHRILRETIRYEEISEEGRGGMTVSSAYDGLVIEL